MPLIAGAHAILYSKDAEADRRFFRDVLRMPSVDVGTGWLIFALPPAELAVHPADEDEGHELYLMVEDVGAFMALLEKHGIACSPPRDLRWGVLTQVTLPGGGQLGAYQPRHARPTGSQSAKRSTAQRRRGRSTPRRRSMPGKGTRRRTWS
jgi:catechol 2,3-dioxygenase-like lactoylglutathione lyase family enzyme